LEYKFKTKRAFEAEVKGDDGITRFFGFDREEYKKIKNLLIADIH
jgi:hypothetical protein